MSKIRTATDKEIECNYFSAIENPFRLYIRLENVSIADVARIFSDPMETRQLWFGDQYIAQCTKLISIVPEPGMIRVTLTKE